MIVNRVLPPEAEGYFSDWRQSQQECLKELRETHVGLPLFEARQGNGEPIGLVKLEALAREVFGDACPPVSATKSLTGHSLGATGVQEAIYSLLMMQNGFICESAHITEIDPDFADMPIVRERVDNVELNTVLSNSFGFGGTNASLVFQRYS